MRFCFEERVEDKNESIKLYETIMIIQLNKMRSKKSSQAHVRFCFEERIEDKKESIKLYETV